MATRDYSNMQEKHIARITGGTITSNSGGTRFGGGDVLTDKFLIEAKTTESEKKSFSIREDWLTKMKEQAFEQGKYYCALAFQYKPDGDNYYIIDERQFLDYLDWREGRND